MDYYLKRADRKLSGKKSGGGCALYVKSHINFEAKPEYIPDGLEDICRIVTFPNKARS